VPSRWSIGEGHVGIGVLEHIDVGLPGVGEDGMPGRNVQRKLGTKSSRVRAMPTGLRVWKRGRKRSDAVNAGSRPEPNRNPTARDTAAIHLFSTRPRISVPVATDKSRLDGADDLPDHNCGCAGLRTCRQRSTARFVRLSWVQARRAPGFGPEGS
jgi:hypothetical protein